ncbi:MAG: hypothetical protein ACHQNA_10085 [Acidimicrobiales bacterium]
MAVLGACILLALGLGFRFLFVTSPDQAAVNRAPRITDTAFEQHAQQVCKRYASAFDTQTTLSKQPTQQQSADFLETIAKTFDAMVVELRAIPVAPADQARVSAWLDDWEAYNAFGHQYATAVRAGAEQQLIVHDSARIGDLRRRRNGFAKANHLSSCVFN